MGGGVAKCLPCGADRGSDPPCIVLPKGWPVIIKSALIHAISLAHLAIIHARGWAANSINARVRLAARVEQAQAEIAMLREEIRIKDTRMRAIPAQRRSHYLPTERMAILELKAARGWSLSQTARAFLITAATASDWAKRVDESGSGALVQLREPVNKFPDFVRLLVQRLKVLCPVMGKVKMVQILARTGLHLGATTIGRMPKETAPRNDTDVSTKGVTADTGGKRRVVTASYPNHAWHVDLTLVPTVAGFAVPWLPFALSQRWPFCWWVAAIVDHFSRRVMGLAVFDRQPTSLQVRQFLARAIRQAGQTPKYIICDKGGQFWCEGFKTWCKRRGIKPRFGAVGRHGSIAVVERFIRSLKSECTRRLLLVPLRKQAFHKELDFFAEWYNEHRPHQWLDGRTPDEVYFDLPPANRAPRWEPRPRWPRGSPCAKPQVLVKGQPGTGVELVVTFQDGRKHLPIVTLKRVA